MAADDLRVLTGSKAIGKAFTGFSAINSVGGVKIGEFFTPTVTAPGKDIGAYQADGTGNQQ